MPETAKAKPALPMCQAPQTTAPVVSPIAPALPVNEDGMNLLKAYFSGPEGLKRSNAFLKFANMLTANEEQQSLVQRSFVQEQSEIQVDQKVAEKSQNQIEIAKASIKETVAKMKKMKEQVQA